MNFYPGLHPLEEFIMYAVITENDKSIWDDSTGVYYHFPSRYIPFLQTGTHVIYYKGSLKENSYKDKRLHKLPHYFGCGVIGRLRKDTRSHKNDWYADIEDYIEFDSPVLAKENKKFLELIPDNRKTNYWRDGVRRIDKEIFDLILSKSGLTIENVQVYKTEYSSFAEGSKKLVYTSKYERSPQLRRETLRIKGTTCVCCGFNFKSMYGCIGDAYIHIHHTKPLHIFEGEVITVSVEDMEPVCPNCHAMLHRKKTKTLSISELKNYISENRSRMNNPIEFI